MGGAFGGKIVKVCFCVLGVKNVVQNSFGLVESLLGEEVVIDVESGGEVVDGRVDLVLDAALALGELGAEGLDGGLVGRGAELDLELRAQRRLALRDEVGADVGPGGGVGGLDRQLGGGEVADLDLRFDDGELSSTRLGGAQGGGGRARTCDSTCCLTMGRIVL